MTAHPPPAAPGGTPAPEAARARGQDPEDWAAGNASDRDEWLEQERPPHW